MGRATAARAVRIGVGLLVCALCGCGAPRPGDVVLISVDTLRADHLGAYGYPRSTTPRIDALFRDGAAFERAYATSSFTTASIVSVLSGLLPQQHGVRLFDQLLTDDVALLPERLPAAYQTAAFVSNGVLSDRGLGIADRFEHFDDDMTRGGGSHRLERNARVTTDAVLEWLETARDPQRPLFLWVHYMDPHEPYAAPPVDAFRSEVDDEPLPPTIVREPERHPDVDARARIHAYDREIAYTDREIGRLLDRYGETADSERALIVLTADHGETLAERRVWFQHAYHVFEELVRVPLLLRGPGVARGRPDAPVSGIDLAPTLLAFAGVGAPEWSDLVGVDLRGKLPADRVLFVESINNLDGHQWRGALTRRGKWVLRIGPASRPRIRARGYFDLAADPGETRLANWSDGAAPAERLLALVGDDPDPAGKPTRYRQGTLAQEDRELLRELGYLR